MIVYFMVRQKNRSKSRSSVAYTRIKVVGVGGAGCSTIQRMTEAKIPNIEYIAVNTDSQSLQSLAESIKKIRIGKVLTKGLGTGGDVELGQAAAGQNTREIKEVLKNADIIFITAGFGGGAGTGASPLIADLASQTKALTIAIVTKPFTFEGLQRRLIAEQGLKKMANRVDALITISNNKLLRVIDRSTPILEAFNIADEVLKQGIQAVFDILNVSGLINVDFADIKPILQGAGNTFLGIGRASGKDRAHQAVKNALKNPLMNVSAKGADGVIFVITGSPDLKMVEVNEIAEIITKQINSRAKIVFGAVIDDKLKDEIKITLIAAGFNRSRHYGFAIQSLVKGEEEQDYKQGSSVDARKVFVYKDEGENEKKEKGKKSESDFYFEDELEIPAFLRKKMRKK